MPGNPTPVEPSGETTITIDLALYGDEGVGIFTGRDRGRAVREACGIRAGDRVRLVAPDYVYSLAAGFADELLRDTVIESIAPHLADGVIQDLVRRRVAFRYTPVPISISLAGGSLTVGPTNSQSGAGMPGKRSLLTLDELRAELEADGWTWALPILDALTRERDAWQAYAEHLEGCVTCGQTSADDCWDGGQLRARARGRAEGANE